MKRLLLSVGLAITALGLATGPALANNGATKTKYTATFTVGAATWTCSGQNIINHGVTGSQDSETCLVTGDMTSMVAGTYTGTPGQWAPCATGYLPPWGDNVIWYSDNQSNVFGGLCSTGWTITETNNGNGTFTVAITAFYPVPS